MILACERIMMIGGMTLGDEAGEFDGTEQRKVSQGQ